jgi:hypothetical protein
MASDYLEPEESLFTGIFMPDYYEMVLSAFSAAYERDVRARAIVFPSFHPEYAVGISEDDGAYRIFHLQPEKQLWGYKTLEFMKSGRTRVYNDAGVAGNDEQIKRLEELLPKDPRDVKIERCDVDIDQSLGRRIIETWEMMLRQTRYVQHDTRGTDGITYHFSMRARHQDLAGKVWTPPGDSKTGMLASVAETMKRICVTGDEGLTGELERRVDDLLALE